MRRDKTGHNGTNSEYIPNANHLKRDTAGQMAGHNGTQRDTTGLDRRDKTGHPPLGVSRSVPSVPQTMFPWVEEGADNA